MTTQTRITFLLLAFCGIASLASAQSLAPSTPSKEYIRLDGQVVLVKNGYLPLAGLSTSNLSFGPQALNTPSTDQTITITNTGNGPLLFGVAPLLGGANPGDFIVSGSNCLAGFGPAAGGAFANGQFCIAVVQFVPQLEGTRTATLTFTDNAGGVAGTTQTINLTGTGSGTAPSAFTTYLAPYGGVQSPFTGPDEVLPLRAYYPGGAAQVGYLEMTLNATAGGATEYSVYAQSNGAGGYTLSLTNGTASVPSSPLLMTATGATVILTTPIALGTLAITSYRFALVGNEFQLDLGLSRSGNFSDQIVIYGVNGTTYSSPWGAALGQWSNLTAVGSTCNGAGIGLSVVAGDGSWQCWAASQLNTTSYGEPYWNGDSGDGNKSNIGWLLIGTGGQWTLPGVTPPGPLGYFGLPGGEQPTNLYFANTSSGTVTPPLALTNNNTFDTLGWYSINPSSPNTVPTSAAMHTLVGPFKSGPLSATFQPTQYYGLFVTAPTGTFFTQAQLNADGLQHFAVFQQSANFYYIGVEDTTEEESDLDYNDMVITLTTTAPTVTLAPVAGLTFPGQIVATTSASQTITVSNGGNAPLTITSITLQGTAAGDFALSNGCGTTLAAGGSCTLTVTFTPTAPGARSATLAITDSAAGSPQTLPLSGTGTALPPAASYVGTDTATLGTWTGTYGTNGQVIANDVSNVPGYAVLSTTGASTYTWAASTTDPRALQISSGSSSRLASAYQSSSSFTLDLNLTDGNTHRISLYLCDWDNSGRTETITVVNAATQAVLSTKTFSSFSGGIYAVWHIAGHVQIQVTDTAVASAIVNAIFFDPLPSATYLGTDTTTLGTWTGNYGANGQVIPGDVSNVPSFAALSLSGESVYLWAATTTDPRALQISSGSSSGIASAYESSASFTLDLNLIDGNTHKVSLYLCDWDNSGRAETITVVNAGSQAVLSTQSFSAFSAGIWASWNLTGHVRIQVTPSAGPNGVVNGIFF